MLEEGRGGKQTADCSNANDSQEWQAWSRHRAIPLVEEIKPPFHGFSISSGESLSRSNRSHPHIICIHARTHDDTMSLHRPTPFDTSVRCDDSAPSQRLQLLVAWVNHFMSPLQVRVEKWGWRWIEDDGVDDVGFLVISETDLSWSNCTSTCTVRSETIKRNKFSPSSGAIDMDLYECNPRFTIHSTRNLSLVMERFRSKGVKICVSPQGGLHRMRSISDRNRRRPRRCPMHEEAHDRDR